MHWTHLPGLPNVGTVTIQESVQAPWTGHARGSAAYGRLLAALFCAGVATFAQLYSPQAVLPLISSDLGVGAADAAWVGAAAAGCCVALGGLVGAGAGGVPGPHAAARLTSAGVNETLSSSLRVRR